MWSTSRHETHERISENHVPTISNQIIIVRGVEIATKPLQPNVQQRFVKRMEQVCILLLKV